MGKPLNIEDEFQRIVVNGRNILLSAQTKNTKIMDSEWLVFGGGEFETAAEATAFGNQLRNALQLSAISTRIGVDAGADRATTGVSEMIKQAIYNETGTRTRDNIHGLDIFEDTPDIFFPTVIASGTVRAHAATFAAELVESANGIGVLSQDASDILLLLNAALMNDEPVAQIVFAVSAVEMLGQKRKWSPQQKALILRLQELARADDGIDTAEAEDVATAMGKMHPDSLRAGVKRLLDSVQLPTLVKQWDILYDERCELVHGLAPLPGKNYSDLAYRTVTLCGHILLRLLEKEVPAAANLIDTRFALPTVS